MKLKPRLRFKYPKEGQRFNTKDMVVRLQEKLKRVYRELAETQMEMLELQANVDYALKQQLQSFFRERGEDRKHYLWHILTSRHRDRDESILLLDGWIQSVNSCKIKVENWKKQEEREEKIR